MHRAKEKFQESSNGAWGGTYFLAIIGAAVYFVQQANGFWEVILAILKAIVWPAFVVYGLLDFLRI
jgi:hypothetical protein